MTAAPNGAPGNATSDASRRTVTDLHRRMNSPRENYVKTLT